MAYKLKTPKAKEHELKEVVMVINGKKYFFWKDYFRGGVKFHVIPDNSVIPIRNANAPTFQGNIEEAIAYVKKEDNIKERLKLNYKYPYMDRPLE